MRSLRGDNDAVQQLIYTKVTSRILLGLLIIDGSFVCFWKDDE